jgi:CheY-like chemotaxis protein
MRPQHRTVIDPPADLSRTGDGTPAVRRPPEKPGVLVVDDDHLVQRLVQLSLERAGFDVWSAANGREALCLYRGHRECIAVVLLDDDTLGRGGSATCAALRKLNPEVRVCFMIHGAGGPEQDGPRQDGVPVIAKPFRVDQLANVLRLLTQSVPTDPLPAAQGCQGEAEGKCRGGTDGLDSCR